MRFANITSRGSVLIIVLWVALGLVAITLYFAHTMTMELRASDNRVASFEAGQAMEGAARYAGLILSNSFYTDRGLVPDITTYRSEAVPIGDARFWLLGRGDQQGVVAAQDIPSYGLIDECSKLNLNTATLEMLEMLPRMTPELAASIIDWRDSNSEVTSGGAESETYQRLKTPYACKNAPFESVDELRLVYNSTTEILFGEDANLNGMLDNNENDGNVSLPDDNHDGRLDPGILDLVTVYSLEPNTRSDGSPRINITQQQQRPQLQSYLQDKFNQQRANEIVAQAFAGGAALSSLLHFYSRSGMTADEFAQIEPDISAFQGSYATGLVNVATAPGEVLACVPGIGTDHALALVNYRSSNPAKMTSIAWVTEVLESTNIVQAGPWITSRSYQYTADIAAVGHYGRGYQRTRFVIDMSTGTPIILHRQDLTHLGWALGLSVRRTFLTQNTR